MQRVRLLGELGELFGAEFTYYNLRRPADAFKLLFINRPGFRDYLLKSEENGIVFQILQANVAMDAEELLLPFGANDLVVVPVIAGSGGAVTKIVTGIAIVAAAIVLAPAGAVLGLGAGLFSATGAGFLTAAAAGAVAAVGASLALGGVAQLISPQPQIPLSIGSIGGAGGAGTIGGGAYGGGGARFGSRNRTNGPTSVTRGLDGQQSYAYTGAVNTVGVGQTVPLAYGKVLIGSHLLRSKVQVTDESDPLLNYIKKPGTDTMLVGGEKFKTTFDDVSGAVIKKVDPFKEQFTSPNGNQVNLGIGGEMALNPDGPSYSGSASERVQKDNTYKNDFNVAFAIKNGLSNPVAGTGTTAVDAFVTYQIEVFRGDNEDPENLVAVDNVTIQGLLDSSPSNQFAYIHQIQLPSMTGNTWVRVKTTLIDSDAGLVQKLKMAAIGYSLS